MTWNTSTSLPRLSRAHNARIGSAASDAARGDVYTRDAFARGGIARRPVMLKLVGKLDCKTMQGRTMRLER